MKRLLLILTLLLIPSAAQAAGIGGVESQSNWGSLADVVEAFFNVLLVFLPAIATIYLAISGYRYMVAQGNPDLIEKAKKSLTYAVFGVVISYTAVLIISYASDSLGFKFGP
ncbi:hypothetical protein EXS54_02935 [Patescibacteria group bacterium]|nr:hypothetical protein [Patescibacteria group bacterium]